MDCCICWDMTSDEPMAIPPVPPIHPSRHRLNQGNNYLSAAASRNAAQTVYPTPKSPNLFPQKCDHFRIAIAFASGRQHNAVAFCELRGLIRGSTRRLLLRFTEVYRDCVRRSLVLLRSRCALCGSCRGRCSWSRGIVAIALRDHSRLIMVDRASSRHCRNRICNLWNPLRSHLETRGIHWDSFLRGRGYIAIALARSR